MYSEITFVYRHDAFAEILSKKKNQRHKYQMKTDEWI